MLAHLAGMLGMACWWEPSVLALWLLECPHSMAADVPLSEQSKKSRQKLQWIVISTMFYESWIGLDSLVKRIPQGHEHRRCGSWGLTAISWMDNKRHPFGKPVCKSLPFKCLYVLQGISSKLNITKCLLCA